MALDLAEPADIQQWLGRLFSPRSVLWLLVLTIALVSELRFDWVERALGAYLVTTNAARPESGTIWEKGHRSLSARETLEELAADRMASRREAQGAESFSQILESLSAAEQAVISADHFRRLYSGLSPELAGEVMSPYLLVDLLGRGVWERTVFRRSGVGVDVYLLNAANGVLRQVALPEPLVDRILQGEKPIASRLEDLPAFSRRIFPAHRFFEALQALPEDVRRDILPWPDALLETGGRVARVGVSDEVRNGRIAIGFEIERNGGHEVVAMEGRDWAVWRLAPLLGAERKTEGGGDRPRREPDVR